MFIKNLVMRRHYNVILENSDITTRPWQRLAISDNLNFLSAYVIWNILVLSITGKVSKIAIMTDTIVFTSYMIFECLWLCRVTMRNYVSSCTMNMTAVISHR